MEIRRMREADIPQVSTLHIKTLPTAVGRIGSPYLSALYRATLPDVCLVAVQRHTIVGVITATFSLSQTQKRLVRLPLRPDIAWNILHALLSRRVTLAELIDKVLFERELRRQFPSAYPTILTFFVDVSHRRQGIGSRLLDTLEKKMSGVKHLYVDTEISNTQAMKWYRHHGFRFFKTIRNSVVAVKTLTSAP